MKRIVLLAFASLLLCHGAAAQSVVQTTPQNVQRRVFNAINSAQASAVITNIGQTVHVLTYTLTAAPCQLRIRLEGSNDGTNFFPISQDSTEYTSPFTGSVNGAAVFAVGYYPAIRANLLRYTGCAGTLTAFYAGSSSIDFLQAAGVFNVASPYRRVLMQATVVGQGGNTNTVYPPNGNSFGIIAVQYSTGAVGGVTTLTVRAGSDPAQTVLGGPAVFTILTATVANNNNWQFFVVPPTMASIVDVAFTCVGAGCVGNNPVNGFYQLLPMNPAMRISDVSAVPQLEPPMVCDQSAAITVAGAGDLQVVGLLAGQRIHVCHISIAYSGATNFQIIQGTGANCVVGTANLSGSYLNVTAIGLDFNSGGPLRTAVSQELCIRTSAAVTGGGIVKFAQF
jgi:hypothetical protein